MKKTLAILLCLCMALGMVSCAKNANNGMPDGMQLASCAGADYYLYVPTTWNPNTHYGVSGAYFHLNKLSNLSAAKYVQTEAMQAEMQAAGLEDNATARIDWYYNTYCRPIVEQTALGGSFEELAVEGAVTVLGDANAKRFHCKMTVNGISSQQYRVIAERNGAFYVLTFSVANDLHDMLYEQFESVVKEFKFTDTPYAPEAVKVLESDPNAPAGMVLASNDEVAYRFYVPQSWTINQNERIFAAYVEDDRTSVSVVPYMPDAETLSIGEFFVMTRDKMIEIADKDGYVEVSAPDTNWMLGERVATAYRYRLTVNGRTYEYLQVVAAYKSMIYSVTYTASSQENYDRHYDEFKAIVDAFCFE